MIPKKKPSSDKGGTPMDTSKHSAKWFPAHGSKVPVAWRWRCALRWEVTQRRVPGTTPWNGTWWIHDDPIMQNPDPKQLTFKLHAALNMHSRQNHHFPYHLANQHRLGKKCYCLFGKIIYKCWVFHIFHYISSVFHMGISMNGGIQ